MDETGGKERTLTYVKINDDIWQHPKIVEVGGFGLAVHVAGIAYCGHNLTDGLISRQAAKYLVYFEGAIASTTMTEITALRIIEDGVPDCTISLIEAGLWHRQGHACSECIDVPFGKYRIHQYEQYQALRYEVEAKKEQAAERKRRQRRNAKGQYSDDI